MAQYVRWIGILAMAWAAGCGRKEAQVVKPQVTPDSEVAVWIDQASITTGQIRKEVERLFANVPKDVPPPQLEAAKTRILQQAVDNLVTRQLVQAEMERSGVLITQAEIDAGKQQLEKGLGEGHSLAMMIAEANLPMEELENNLRLDLFKNKVLKDKLEADVGGVTEETARTYFNGHPEEFTRQGGRLVSHILVRVPAEADEKTKTDLRAKAEGIRKSLVEGADFEKLAAEVSDCPSRARGGAVGVVPKGREAPAFEAAVYGQAIGEIGEVVESPIGFHVIKVTGEQETKVFTFDEVKDNLVSLLKARAQQKVGAEYVAGLREKATVKFVGPLADMGKPAAPPAEAAAPAEASVTAPAGEVPAVEAAPAAAVPAEAPAAESAPVAPEANQAP